jgi:hypothetical protein
VIRGGGGMYWDTQPIWEHFREGAAIGPAGDGRTTLAASAFTNIFPTGAILNLSLGGAPLAKGAPLPVNALTTMTLGQFIQIMNQELPAITAELAPTPPSSGAYSVTGIDLAKQGIDIYPSSFPLLRSYQTSIGVQHEFGRDMLLSVDWARKQDENVNLGELDLNHFGRTADGLAPIIPQCAPSQYYVPGQECSTGSITFWVPEGRRLAVFGEAFNLLNIANLTGYNFTLDAVKSPQTFAFGQPTSRGNQVFGSGGPRAFQFGARFSF